MHTAQTQLEIDLLRICCSTCFRQQQQIKPVESEHISDRGNATAISMAWIPGLQ